VFTSYVDTQAWVNANVPAGEYNVVASRAEEVPVGKNKIYCYPSVHYVSVYANMLRDKGSLNYPPAGWDTGVVSVASLVESDFGIYADQLKTNKINWLKASSKGTCFWEQRTRNPVESDLSYIAPTFILRDLREQILSFEENFNFRYTTPTSLLMQQSGLDRILNEMAQQGFISEYTLKVPSYKEAQAAGRTLTIHISVAIAQDSEEIVIDLELVNATN
jgi:hypothetical protein